MGTQFYGLGHVGTRMGAEDIFHNGIKRTEMRGAYGLEKLGVENAGVFFTRGVLVDVAGDKNVDRLDIGYVITLADIKGALQRQGVAHRRGPMPSSSAPATASCGRWTMRRITLGRRASEWRRGNGW